MSVSIDVYPSLSVIPTLGQLERAVEEVIREQRSHPVVARELWGRDGSDPEVTIGLMEDSRYPSQEHLGRDATLMMEGNTYGSLNIIELESGFDFHFWPDDDEEIRHQLEVEDCAARAREIGALDGFPFEACAEVGHRWYMRLSAGQPDRTRVLAGCAAVALARLTQGFLHSDDNGMDYSRSPADPEDFLTWYFDWLDEE